MDPAPPGGDGDTATQPAPPGIAPGPGGLHASTPPHRPRLGADFRAVSKFRDNPRTDLRHWDVPFHDRATALRDRTFHFIMDVDHGEVVLLHRPD